MMDPNRSLPVDEALRIGLLMNINYNNINSSNNIDYNRRNTVDGDSDFVYNDAQSASRILPLNFQLSNNDVLCGRGSQCFNHEGNQKFRQTIQMNLRRYSMATTKYDKTNIIREIIAHVRHCSPSGGFVKLDLDSGRYFEIGDFHAREKTSQAFRDALQEKYKSSYVSRKKRRTKSDDNNDDNEIANDHCSTTHPTCLSNDECIRVLEPQQNQASHNETVYFHPSTVPILASIQSIQMSSAPIENRDHYNLSGRFEELKNDYSQEAYSPSVTQGYQTPSFLTKVPSPTIPETTFPTTPHPNLGHSVGTRTDLSQKLEELPNSEMKTGSEATASTSTSIQSIENIEKNEKRATTVNAEQVSSELVTNSSNRLEWIDEQSRLLDPMFVTGIVPIDCQFAPDIGHPNHTMYQYDWRHLHPGFPDLVLSQTHEELFLVPQAAAATATRVETTDCNECIPAISTTMPNTDSNTTKTNNNTNNTTDNSTNTNNSNNTTNNINPQGKFGNAKYNHSKKNDHIPTASELTDLFVSDSD